MYVTHNYGRSNDYTLVRSTFSGHVHNKQRSVFMVVDLSGSMRRSLPVIKRAAKLFVMQLQDGSSIRLSTFSDTVSVILDIPSITRSSIEQVYQALDQMKAKGATNTHASLVDLSQALHRCAVDEAVQVEVHYFTDGMPTVGDGTSNMVMVSEDAVMAGFSPGAMQPFMAVYAMGTRVNHAFAQRIAERVDGGQVYCIETDDDIGMVWGRVNAAMNTTIAARITLNASGGELVLGELVHHHVADGQTITTLWLDPESTVMIRVTCDDCCVTDEEDVHGYDAGEVDRWVNYMGLKHQLSLTEKCMNWPQNLFRMWVHYVVDKYKDMNRLPEGTRVTATRKLAQLKDMIDVNPIALTRSFSRHIAYMPPGLTRSLSHWQTSSGAVFAGIVHDDDQLLEEPVLQRT